MNQRTIKFRAWDKDSQSMLTGFFLTPTNIIVPPFFANSKKNNKIKVEWMQFTGLLDKLGKEIYEEDILRKNCRTYVNPSPKPNEYKFEEGYKPDERECGHCYVNIKVEDMIMFRIRNVNFRQEDFEIIGNIYENKSLLQSVDSSNRE